MLRILLWIVVAGHMAIVVGNILAFILLPFYAEWYVALPLMSFILFLSTNKVTCKITDLENYIRGRLGYRRIGGFVGHYLLKPINRFFDRRN